MKNQTQKLTQSTNHLRLYTKTPAKSTSMATENAIETAETTLNHYIQDEPHCNWQTPFHEMNCHPSEWVESRVSKSSGPSSQGNQTPTTHTSQKPPNLVNVIGKDEHLSKLLTTIIQGWPDHKNQVP